MERLLCLGDSITDCGRVFENPPLGCGYVHILKEKFLEQNRDIPIRNCGVNGFTAARLLANAERNFYPVKNSTVTILIGINDIGLMMNTNRTETQKQLMMEEFFVQYEKLIRLLVKDAENVILMEPFIFPRPQEFLLWIPLVQTMSAGISRLGQKYALPYIKLHKFLNAAASPEMNAVTSDGIHLTAEGHRLLAEKLFQVLNEL